jgi:hypothetical protein
MKEKKFKILMLIISALMLVNLQCDSENPIDPTENVLMIKATSGYAASNVMHISSKIYKCALTMPNNATYDNGWWSFTIDLPNQHNAQMQIQFKDVNGNIQKFYNTLTTYYIIGKGTASGPKGSVEFNLTLSGLNLSSSYFVVNGDAQAKYQGTTANVEVKDFKMPKEFNKYPTDGTITVWVLGAKVTITFNGTRFAHGSFIYNSVTYEFTIDLESGQIS